MFIIILEDYHLLYYIKKDVTRKIFFNVYFVYKII